MAGEIGEMEHYWQGIVCQYKIEVGRKSRRMWIADVNGIGRY